MTEPLERSVKRLRIALAAVTAVALLPWAGVALIATGAIPRATWTSALPRVLDLPCEIQARGYRAIDENGREIAFVGRHGKGGGNVTLRNAAGEQILVAGDFDGHGGFLELGTAKRIGVHLGAGDTPDGFLMLRNEAGRDLAYLGRDDDGDGLFFINRADGGDLATIGRGEQDDSFVHLIGPSGKSGALLMAAGNGGELDLFDADARKFLYAGPTETGSGFVKVLDDDGSLLAAFGASGSSARAGFFKAFTADEEGLFYAGDDQRGGHGVLNVCSKEGRMIVAIGIDGAEQGGVLNVFDLAGTMVLREPDWP